MDRALLDYVKKHSGMPLPELKLELMKRGFSSYQIEQALEDVRAKRRSFLISFSILLIIAIILVIVGLVFISFIRPAEELVKVPVEKQTQAQKWIAVPSERPAAPSEPYVEEEIEEKIVEKEFVKKTEAIPSKTLEEIRELSNSNPQSALEQCSLLENSDECISLVAKNSDNANACNQIVNSDIRDNCFFFFGQSNKEYCENIVSANVRNNCFIISDIQEIS
ncbi:hypothetical protein JW851_00275 [Candidatus Woesearchaeota archaeon]|nr:hypothetical protein [Candidatus Woesearchaeota archaeon]